MRNTIWTPVLSALGVALLVSSCAGDASASDRRWASAEHQRLRGVRSG
ncbi:hypothetical protein [Nesterenkonia muleiensis]|nr:hypothetical protein [Nesterenkonia muleiensis]